MKLKPVVNHGLGGALAGYSFECPGCKDSHYVPTTGDHAWGFNGNVERPTFTPSILVRWRDHSGSEVAEQRCHSFVIDGRIQFLSDCGHELAGKTVDLPDV